MGPGHLTDTGYTQFSGTSMACPHAVGMAARMYSELSDEEASRMTPEMMKAKMVKGATFGVIELQGETERATSNR